MGGGKAILALGFKTLGFLAFHRFTVLIWASIAFPPPVLGLAGFLLLDLSFDVSTG
jgi:hypothetical protein